MKKITLVAKLILCCWMLAAMSGTVFAQQAVLLDLGMTGTVPNPPLDVTSIVVSNLSSGTDVQFPDGLNYYDNNNSGNTPGGQVFKIDHPMELVSVAIQMGGDFGANSYGMSGGPAPFFLRLFQIGDDGTTATWITTYQSQTNATFAGNHWIQWTNITVPLVAANKTFAYTFACDSDPTYLDSNGHPEYNGWAQLYASSGNRYTNGEICTIDNAGGASTIHHGGAYSGFYDGNFALYLKEIDLPITTPIIISPTNVIFLGTTVTFNETAGGQVPLSYQWQATNGTDVSGGFTNIPAAITNFYGPVTPGATGNYYFTIIVTNNLGATTSAVAQLTVIPASSPLLTTDVSGYNTNVYGFVGGSVNFYANCGLGTLPITNKWMVKLDSGGNYTPVAGDPSSAWTCTNVQLTSSGYYKLTGSNAVAPYYTNSTPAHLTALADPPTPDVMVTNVVSGVTNLVTSYAYYVVTNKPWAYWRFEETTNSFTNSMQAYDYSGHNFDATYLSASTNIIGGTGCYDGGEAWNNGFGGPGSRMSGDKYSGFPTNNMCAQMNYNVPNGYLTVPSLNMSLNTVTFTMWIRPNSGIVNANAGLLTWHGSGGDVAGVSFGQNLDVNTAEGRFMPELGYTWNTNNSSTYYFHSHLYPVGGIWSFAAWVISPTNCSIYLYYVTGGHTNLTKAINVLAHTPESFSGGLTCIGTDNGNTARTFDGNIDDVAVFTNALTEIQIQNLFLKSIGLNTGVAPIITTINNQPNVFNPLPGTSDQITVFQGQPLRISANGGGIPAPTWQWEGGNNQVIGNWNSGIVLSGDIADTKIGPSKGVSGSTTTTLVFSNYNSPFEWLAVKCTNTVGGTFSSWVRINFIPIPGSTNAQWTMNFNVLSEQNGGPNTNYNARGILGTGTNWNALRGNQLQNSTYLLDNGTIGPAIHFGATNYVGNYFAGGGAGTILLDQYATWVTNGIEFDFTGVPCGLYNLALFGVVGNSHNHAVQFTVLGQNQSVTNAQDVNFAPDNSVVYTNLLVTNGVLAVAMVPVPGRILPGGPWWLDLAGAFNGAQLQLVTNGPAWTVPFTNNTLTWNYGGLLEATNILGPWTTNRAVSPYTFSPTGCMKFYRIYNPNF